MATVLLVDDNEQLLEMLAMLLRANGYQVETACDGQRIADLVSTRQFDLVVTDVIMPNSDGMEVMMFLKREKIPFIAMSGGGALVSVDEVFALARKLGASAILEKPFTEETMLAAVTSALAAG